MATWVVHYGEIGIKGDNRFLFERRLVSNIKQALGGRGVRVLKEFGRLVITGPDLDPNATEAALSSLPGIVNFAQVSSVTNNTEAIANEAVRLTRESLERTKARTFCVRTRRSNKQFPLTSVQLNREVGAAINSATALPVELETPDLTVRIEIAAHEALIYTRRIPGVGGLPVGMSGRVVVMLSGGIDSPVAAFKLMRRGCQAVFVHFHNYTHHEEKVRAKIEDLAKELARFQLVSKLWLLPFAEMQEALLAAVPPPARMVAYRRAMLRIAAEIAGREHAHALVTGDSVGQVASQTLENLHAAYSAVELPVLTPLIGDDKSEITALARRIGTFEISTRPYEDCCSFMVSRHPDTKTRLLALEESESRIPFDELTKRVLDRAEVLEFAASSARGLTNPTPGP